MHESCLGLVHPGIIEIVEDRDDNLQDITALQHVVEELLVVFTQLPEQDQQLLMEVNLLLRP